MERKRRMLVFERIIANDQNFPAQIGRIKHEILSIRNQQIPPRNV